jgi:hypothetical protein
MRGSQLESVNMRWNIRMLYEASNDNESRWLDVKQTLHAGIDNAAWSLGESLRCMNFSATNSVHARMAKEEKSRSHIKMSFKVAQA